MRKRNWQKLALTAGGTLAPMPDTLIPQICTLVHKPFSRPGWIFEIKWDGYRCLAFRSGARSRLISRNGHSLNSTFPKIVEAVAALPCDAILDGEITALDAAGRSVFNALQRHAKNVESIVYYAFDLLYLDGVDLRGVPLIDRKKLLAMFLPGLHERLLYTDHIEAEGEAFFEVVKAQGLEGMVAKDARAPYKPGQRTMDWQKVKAEINEEFVIAGYTEPDAFSHFDKLILARRDKAGLHYGGTVKNGISPRARRLLRERLDQLKTKKRPFPEAADVEGTPVWVRPELACLVAYVERTPSGNLRHANFVELL